METRANLEKVVYQLNDLNGSHQFIGRFHFSSTWRLTDSNQHPVLYINSIPHQPVQVGQGLIHRVPTFHLVAEGLSDSDDLLIRLIAYNGKPLKDLDEKFSNLQYNLANSKLLVNYVENKFALCQGLGKLPRRSQLSMLNKNQVQNEMINDTIMWRSSECKYAVTQVGDTSQKISCSECKHLQEESDEVIKIEPDDDEPLFEDDLIDSLRKPKLSVSKHLEKLKLKGIVVNPTEKRKKPPTRTNKEPATLFDDSDSNEDNFLDDDHNSDVDDGLPHQLVTVTMGHGNEKKIVPFENLRKSTYHQRSAKTEPVPKEPKKKGTPVQKRIRLSAPKPTAKQNDISKEKDSDKEGEEIEKPILEPDIPDFKKCSICQELFTDVNVFISHLIKCKVNAEDESDDEEDEPVDGDNDDGKEDELDENGIPKQKLLKKKKKKKKKRYFPLTALSCCICGQSFKLETHYEMHVKAHEDKLKLDDPVVCPVCNENLTSKRHLNPHFKMAHPKDGACCVECLEIMPVENLKQHLSKVHQQTGHKEEGHLCPDCGKKCQYLSELEIHMAIQHMGMVEERPDEEELMCHECGKVFNTRKKLKHHLSNTHKSRDHPCQFCAKVFCHRHQLTKHMLTHSDIKPFKCKYCEYQNARKYRVINHCQKAHNIEATDQDIEVMKGGNRPAEFLQNYMNL